VGYRLITWWTIDPGDFSRTCKGKLRHERSATIDPNTETVQFLKDLILFGKDLFLLLVKVIELGLDRFKFPEKFVRPRFFLGANITRSGY